MEKTKKLLKNWPLHLILLIVVVICEAINTITIHTPIGNVLFLPMLFALVIGLALYLIKPIKVVKEEQSILSSDFVVVGIGIFLAKVAVTSGSQIMDVIQAGPALLLQEFGNLGTIILALPIALLLGFGREAVGMTYSICREPNVGLIANRYGLNSPEGRGVMTTYIVGTLLGTIFIGLLASLLAALDIIHPYALAMACGVGSGSMLAAASSTLADAFPEMADQIVAYAGTSNVLTNADGILMSVIIGLPLCNFLYRKLYPVIGRGRKEKAAAATTADVDTNTKEKDEK